jgi:hypothetical protein
MKKSNIQPTQKYGKLSVIRRDLDNPNRKPFWICDCECGKETSVRADYLVGGKIISCGCYRLSKFVVSEENVQKCLSLYSENTSIENTAKAMRISPSNVQKLLSVSGIEVFISGDELSNYRYTDKLRWAKKYIGYGMSLEAIASAENTTIATVSVALNKLGIPLRDPGSQSPEMVSKFKAKATEYWQFYEKGMSLAQIAELFGLPSPNYVGYILRAHGYKLRSRKEATELFHGRKRIAFRRETRRLIGDRGVKLSETKKAGKLRRIEKL